ncbi:hypothetical protein SMICM17S_06592 [Streptomyces microflavus]
MLNGVSSRLVKDDTSGKWRLEGDDASQVTRSTGADNGDNDGEYWTVVKGDGTSYVFGRDKLDGAGTERTNSTWTVPVYGDDSGEPGYDAGGSFADRSVKQAWRWNLDYTVDTNNNAATYWYAAEANYYKKSEATKAGVAYTRGGYLKEVRYGLRKDALFTDDADAKVTFDYAERCTASDCSSLNEDTADNWPDVPFNAICAKDSDDCLAEGPAFFSRKRLTGVNTFSWSAAEKKYAPVDSWDFTQQYLDGGDIGDTSDQVLTLKSIKRTGLTGTAVTLDPVSFTYQMRPNRVDGTDDILPLTRPRMSTITSETGSITTVTLSSAECTRAQVVGAEEDSNTRSCYPQYWNINGASEASVDWFQKYRVLAVTVSDPAGQNDTVENEYAYSGAAWHYSDEPFTPKDERTWSDWRGYRQVTVYGGAKDAARSKTVSLYLQGMDGDKKKDGTTRAVTVPALTAPALGIPALKDAEQYAGELRQSVVYDGATPISATMNVPWSKETARQSVPGAGDQVARYVRTAASTSYTYLTVPKTWRSTGTASSFDDFGMARTTSDLGDLAKSGDETCTRLWYARNEAAGLTSLVSRTRTVAKACSVTEAALALPANKDTRGDVLSDTATVYDTGTVAGWTPDQKPTKGAGTWTGRATGYPATATGGERNPTGWQRQLATTYDALGRTLTVTDAQNNVSRTAYTPVAAGPLTKTVLTNAKGHTAVTFLDPRRALPERTYDNNQSELLIRRAAGAGDTVLYLGATEVRLTVKGTAKSLSGTRYYSAAGRTLAVRTATAGTASTQLSFLTADHHGTSSLAIEAVTQAVTKRYSTPFGAPRGDQPTTTWPDDKAFLGKPADITTGLTHIGAREYDTGVGQFLSVDPVLSIEQHQSLNGYTYANQNPATNSDPTGLACYGGNHSASCNPTGQGGDAPAGCYAGNMSASCVGYSGDNMGTGGGGGSVSSGGSGNGFHLDRWNCRIRNFADLYSRAEARPRLFRVHDRPCAGVGGGGRAGPGRGPTAELLHERADRYRLQPAGRCAGRGQ